MILGIPILFIFVTFSTAPLTFAATNAASAAGTDLLLVLDGEIYPTDQFPGNCRDLLRGAKCDAKAFGRLHVESKKDGDLIYSKSVTSSPAEVQVIEQAWEKDGHVSQATLENKILKKLYEVEIKNGKAIYKITDQKTGTVKTSDEDASSDLVVPSTLMAYLRPFHAQLMAGKEIPIRIAVLDRMQSYGFTLRKIRDEKAADGTEVKVLELSASSLFVRPFVDSMYFYMKADSGELFGFEGKSVLRRKVGDEYKELVAKTAYHYQVDQLKVAAQAQSGGNLPCSDEMIKTGVEKCAVPTESSPAASSTENQ